MPAPEPRPAQTPRRLRLTVRRAVLLAVLLGMLLPALVVGMYLARIFYSEKLEAEVRAALTHNSELLAVGVSESLWSLDYESVTAMAAAVMNNPALVRVEVQDPKLGRIAFREQPERRLGRSFEAEAPVQRRGENIGSVRIEITDAPLRDALGQQMASLAGLLLLQITGSMALILFVLQHRIGAPLRRLGEEAELLARGELEHPIVALRDDEIGDLENRLEITRQALQGLFRSLEQKNHDLETDLEERRHVEAALRDREQRLRAMVEQSPLAVIEFDLDWHVLDWNDTAERIFGWPRDAALGQHASRIIDLPEADVASNLEASIPRGHTTLRCRHSDGGKGTQIICQWYNSVIRDASGHAQRIVALVEDITERQRSDDEIRRLAAVVRLTTNLVALTDKQGSIEWLNPAFANRLGAAASSMLGQPLASLLHIDTNSSAPQAGTSLANALASGQMLTEPELPCATPAGETFWVSMELQPIRDEQGQILQWIALLTDISERRRMAEGLRNIARIGGDAAPNRFFGHLLTALASATGARAAYLASWQDREMRIEASWALPDWPLQTEPAQDGCFLAHHAATEGALLLSRDAGATVARDAVVQRCNMAEALALEPILEGGNRVIGHIVLLFAQPLTDAASVQSLVELGAARASAEFLRLRALEALRQSEQKFFSIFVYSPIPIGVLRCADGRCLDVNPSFLNTFGYRRDAIVGRNMEEMPLYVDQAERQWIRQLLDEQQEVSGADLRLRTQEGDIRDCQAYIRPVRMNNEDCLLVAIADVTQLLEAQRQVEELNQSLEKRVTERTHDLAQSNAELETTLDRLKHTMEELVRAEKLAALGSLVAGIAHELNTPIGNSLMVASTLHDLNRGFRDQMQAGLKRSVLDAFVNESESAADILLRNLHRAAELISSFKQVAVDQTSSQRRIFDLAEVVGEIVVTMHPTFRKTPYRIETDIPPGLVLDSFPGPFGQVVANLLNNTILHAFEGKSQGTVRLQAAAESADWIRFSCRDDGVGIPAANLRRVFDPFFTTRLGRDGTGLGLNIVHNIVTSVLGGEIALESTEGQGSSFIIRLPVRAPGAEATVSKAATE